MSLGRRLARSQIWLDDVAQRLQPLVGEAVGSRPWLHNLLDGTWLGAPLHRPWHGSRFDLRSGRVLEGPAVFAQPRYEVRAHHGEIQMRQPCARSSSASATYAL